MFIMPHFRLRVLSFKNCLLILHLHTMALLKFLVVNSEWFFLRYLILKNSYLLFDSLMMVTKDSKSFNEIFYVNILFVISFFELMFIKVCIFLISNHLKPLMENMLTSLKLMSFFENLIIQSIAIKHKPFCFSKVEICAENIDLFWGTKHVFDKEHDPTCLVSSI